MRENISGKVEIISKCVKIWNMHPQSIYFEILLTRFTVKDPLILFIVLNLFAVKKKDSRTS